MSAPPTELSLSERIAEVIARIPAGRVATYGQVAMLAGSPRAARQVVRTLKMWSGKRSLPWCRVVNRQGRISLAPGAGGDEQRVLLDAEGVTFGLDGGIDLVGHLWDGHSEE